MQPRPHQIAKAEEAYKVLSENMIAYLAMEERTGKTLAALLVCEKIKPTNFLVVTKKNALEGWKDTLDAFDHTKNYTVVNYHKANKVDPKDFEVVILDEAHNYISSFPKKSKLWDDVAKLTKDKPLLYISATPYAQGTQLLYHQFALSSWSPFRKWKNAYNWFRSFGIPETIYLSGHQIETYKQMRDEEVLVYCRHLFITGTRKELGFEHEPEDKLHYIELGEKTKQVYNILVKHRIIELNGMLIEYDTPVKLRTGLHMLEGGVAKGNSTKDTDTGKVIKQGTYMTLGNTEKVDYIKEHFPDQEHLAIMYQYKEEKRKLEKAFPNATVLQATSFAEGVDLSHIKHLVIYSQDFSTARHSQRRARQANMQRKWPITVHFLLVKGAVSEQVYQTVSVNKENFVDSVFKKETI